MARHPKLCLLALSATLVASTASALVLDWNGETWTANPANVTNSNSYETDAAKAGADVNVSTNDNWNELGTPAVNQSLQGGNASPTTSLVFTPDLTRDTHSFTLTISFNTTYAQGVSNVSFTLFDIDASGTWIDQVRSISATSVTGTAIAPTITAVAADVTLSGSGVNQVLQGNALAPDTAAGSGDGNATISFNADGIRTISLTFGEPTGGPANPSAQNFGLSNITYSPVPEMNPTIAAVAICAIAAAAAARHRGRRVWLGITEQ